MWVRPNQDCCVELVMIRGGNACRMEWEVKGHDEVEASKKKKSEKMQPSIWHKLALRADGKTTSGKSLHRKELTQRHRPRQNLQKPRLYACTCVWVGVYAHSQEPKGTCVISCACVSGLEGLLIRPRKKQITFNEKTLNVRSQYKHVLSKQRA